MPARACHETSISRGHGPLLQIHPPVFAGYRSAYFNCSFAANNHAE
jgi:hypothetical protein